MVDAFGKEGDSGTHRRLGRELGAALRFQGGRSVSRTTRPLGEKEGSFPAPARSPIALTPDSRKEKGVTASLRQHRPFIQVHLYPDPLHLVEASYPWERQNAA
jgi:hypothetical protein